jgi:glyoxylate utilization-related uncharacterized protein
VETTSLRNLVDFFEDAAATATVFESERLWSEIICLGQKQELGPIGDPGSDALFLVVAGEVVVQVDRSRKRLKQWGAALVEAGGDVTVTNASTEPAVVLIVAAPPPARRAVTG